MSNASVRQNIKKAAALGMPPADGGRISTFMWLSRFFSVLCFFLMTTLAALSLSLIHITKEAEVNSVLVTAPTYSENLSYFEPLHPDMPAMDILAETGEHDPETAIQMMKLLLDTAESHLQDPEAAYFLLGNELYDLCLSGYIRPRLLDHLKTDDRLARQLFQSAYVGSPQEDILLSCSQMGERDLRQKLLDLLACNPFPHDEIEFETDEE